MRDLYKKLAIARVQVGSVAKTKTADTGSYQYRYATLGDVMAAVDAACEHAGITWVQGTTYHGDDNWSLDTMIIDPETGEFLTFSGAIGKVKGDPQATGGQMTYYRRYGLVTLFGLNVEDDDGQQASRAHKHETTGEARTDAEKHVLEIVKLMNQETKQAFGADFRDEFGSGMNDLPESRHGEALHFAKFWTEGGVGVDMGAPGTADGGPS